MTTVSRIDQGWFLARLEYSSNLTHCSEKSYALCVVDKLSGALFFERKRGVYEEFAHFCRVLYTYELVAIELQHNSIGPSESHSTEPKCVYCGQLCLQPRFESVKDYLGITPGLWTFWDCPNCHSATLYPMPSADRLAGFYPSGYHFVPGSGRSCFKRMVHAIEYYLFYRPQNRMQLKTILGSFSANDGSSPRRVLDLGCGSGIRLSLFKENGFDACGIEFHRETARRLETEPGIKVVYGDLRELALHFEGNSFGLISAFNILEHLVDVQCVLKQCWQLLEPGGWLVGSVPLVDSLQAKLLGSRWIVVREAPRHISLPTRLGLSSLISRTGFRNLGLRRDSSLLQAGFISLTLLPKAATGNANSLGQVRGRCLRILAALLTVVFIPLVLIENLLLHRYSSILFWAQKPRDRRE